MRLFISYAHIDKPIVEDWIVNPLRAGNHDVWFDARLIAGQEWQQQLYDEIQRSDALIFCITPESIGSEWCQWELKTAVDLGKQVVPVLLQAGTKLSENINQIQYVDFSNGATSDAVARLMGGLQQLSPAQIPPAPTNPQGTPSQAVKVAEKTGWKMKPIEIIGVVIAFVSMVAAILALVPRGDNTPEVLPTPATPIVRADEETNIRIGPSVGFEIMMTWDGRPMDILGISEDGLWYQVLLHDGRRGWVLTSQNVVKVDGDRSIIRMIEVTDTPAPVPTNTNIPSITPSETLSPTDTAKPTDTLTMTNIPPIPPTATSTNTPPPTQPPDKCIGTIPGVGGMINLVKVLPNPSSPTRSPVQRGATVVVLAQASDFGTTWYQIQYDGNSGWIPEDYIDVPNNCP